MTKCARARTRDLSLKVQKFAVCVKRKRKDDCGATLLPPVFSRVERGHIRQKVCILTNLVATVTKRARGGWVALDVPPAAARQTRMSVASVETQIAWLKDSVAALTLGSAVSSLKASYTCRSLTPPPRSRKLAGFPPCRSMMSHVAMAKPAPFTGGRGH